MNSIGFFEGISRIEQRVIKEDFNENEIVKKLGQKTLVDILNKMLTTRLLDEKIYQLIMNGTPITQHDTTGQEGSQTVACSLLEEGDYVAPNHRGWGWAIGKGLELNKIFAELMGKKAGYCKGKGGPHLASRKHNLLLRSGIQGSYICLATGVGMGLKLLGISNICLCIFGDGASNAGYVHEGMNIAGTHKLPVIFFCENNGYALFTKYTDTTAVNDIASRASGYNMPGYIVNGMNPLMVADVVLKAISRAKKGDGPTLIESKTYRFKGHTTFDNFGYGVYRSKKEVDDWQKRDPIEFVINKLIDYKIISEMEIKEMKDRINTELEEAVKFALESEFPKPEDFLLDVYSDERGGKL